MIGLSIITEPTQEPVTLQQAKDHLRIDHPDQNDLINSLIKAARIYCEQSMSRAFIITQYLFTIASFTPSCLFVSDRKIKLPRGRVQQVDKIEYYDTDNQLQTFDQGGYMADVNQEPGVVHIYPPTTIPCTYDRPDAVRITFTAGYGSTHNKVPETIKLAIKSLVVEYYNNPGAVAFTGSPKPIPFSLQCLINANRIFI